MIMMFIIHSSLENRIINGIEALIHVGLPNYMYLLKGNTLKREGAAPGGECALTLTGGIMSAHNC